MEKQQNKQYPLTSQSNEKRWSGRKFLRVLVLKSAWWRLTLLIENCRQYIFEYDISRRKRKIQWLVLHTSFSKEYL